MEYPEHLAIDCVDLVQRLLPSSNSSLADLIQTTESARTFKLQLELANNDKILAQEQVAPLRNEIQRLTSENNKLHHDVVLLQDEREKKDRATETYTRQLQTQNADLRFLSTQYSHQLESEKKRADSNFLKVEDMFVKIGMINDAGRGTQQNKTNRIFQRLQKIDIETGLEPLENQPVYFQPPDPAVADIVRLTQGIKFF